MGNPEEIQEKAQGRGLGPRHLRPTLLERKAVSAPASPQISQARISISQQQPAPALPTPGQLDSQKAATRPALPPAQPAPFDMRPAAVRQRGWVPGENSGTRGKGWAAPQAPHGLGTMVIREFNDPNGSLNAPRFADPRNPFSRGIQKGGRGPGSIGRG